MTATPGVRLHVVSGKGGTGKTTVAGSLALALATGGRRVLLAEVEGRGGIAQLFDTPPLGYDETKIAVAPGGGDVYGLAIDPEEALLEYLEMFYNLRRAGRMLRRMGAVDFATTVAPGMRDVLLTGKVMEATRRTGPGGRPVYDAVVLDAPPTGRITRFLNVNAEVAGLARSGPIHGHAERVMSVIRSPVTAVHLVTLLEEMPVQETRDAAAELRSVGLQLGSVVVNQTRPPLLEETDLRAARRGRLGKQRVAAGLVAAGVDASPALVAGLLEEAAAHAARVDLESRERGELTELGLPMAELPLLAETIDVGSLYHLAGLLREQGLGS